MILAAILVYCTQDLTQCQVVANKDLHTTEESCLEALAIGYQIYSEQGFVVPVYTCAVIKEEKKDA